MSSPAGDACRDVRVPYTMVGILAVYGRRLREARYPARHLRFRDGLGPRV